MPEHCDYGLVTILISNEFLQARVDGEWCDIDFPKDHVLVFTGSILSIETGMPALLHRVPQVSKDKFSVGLFIDPPPGSKIRAGEKHKDIPEKYPTVGEYQLAYFGGKIDKTRFC